MPNWTKCAKRTGCYIGAGLVKGDDNGSFRTIYLFARKVVLTHRN